MKKGVVSFLSVLVGAGVGFTSNGIINKKYIEKKDQKIDKFKSYYKLLNQWLQIKQNNKNLVDYFNSNHIEKIAIYGMGELGSRLVEELKDSNIQVLYGIDKTVACSYDDLSVISVEEEFEAVDAIIVTPIFIYNEIENTLKEKTNIPILSLEDIIEESL